MSLAKIRKALKDHKIVYGTERTLKNLKNGKVHTVFLASTCPNETKKKILSYKIEVIQLEDPGDEIALICKRPHSINVLSY